MKFRPPLAALLFSLTFVAPVAAQVTLARKFEPGTNYKARETQKITQTLSLGGQDLNTDSSVVTETTTVYQERNEKGELPIQTTIGSLVADLKLPGDIALHFDSATPDAKADQPAYEAVLDIFRKLAGLKLSHNVNPEGKVVEVGGIVEGTQLNADDLKSEYQRGIDLLPKKPLKPGDVWERTEEQSLGQGQIFTFKRSYEYVGPVDEFPTVKGSRKLDKITATDSTVEYSVRPGAGLPITVNKSDLKVVSSKHTMLFDREKGRFVKSESETVVKGDLGLSIMNTNLDGKLDLTMKATGEELP